jgi:4-amino-4-deoxy-L-arabinose transferase-like glycosyltransferase
MTSCMSRCRCGLPVILVIWFALLLLSLVSRNALPVDETRYLGVAWEMWLRGDFLVPYLNGEPYAHKPPLLFWLIHLSWSAFGVSEWAARLVTAIAGLAGAGLALPLGRLLWPRRNDLHLLAVWVLFSTLLWALWSTALMFDLLIAVCAELAWLGIILSWRGRQWSGWRCATRRCSLSSSTMRRCPTAATSPG